MKERIIYLDYLKALAIFLVIIYHSKAYDDVFLPPILSMCVTIFFAVNGYLMLVKRRPYMYLLKKDMKIVFLVFFWGILRSAFQTYLLGGEMSPTVVFSNFFAFKVGYGNYLWFLVALCILNLINPLVFAFVHNSSHRDKIIFCLLLLVFTANFINVFSWKFNPLAHWYHYEAIFYYVTGFFAVMYAARIKWPWWKCALVFAGFFLIQMLQNILFDMPEFSRFRIGDKVFGNYASIWVMGETLALIVLFSKLNLKNKKIIGFIGSNTLGIYLLQDFFCSITRNIMPREFQYAYPLLVMLVCIVVLWLFDKTRVLRWFVKF